MSFDRVNHHVISNSETGKKRLCIDFSQTINLFTNLDAYPLPRIDDLVNKLARYSVFSTYDLRGAYHQVEICESDKPFTAFEAAGRLWEFNRLPFGVTNGVPKFQRKMDEMVDQEKLSDTYPYLDNITIAGRTQSEHDVNVARFLDAIKRRNITLNEDKTISSVTEISILGYIVSNGNMKPDPERFKPLKQLPAPTNSKALKRVLGLFAYYAKWIQNFSEKISKLKNVQTFPLDSDSMNDSMLSKNQLKKRLCTRLMKRHHLLLSAMHLVQLYQLPLINLSDLLLSCLGL